MKLWFALTAASVLIGGPCFAAYQLMTHVAEVAPRTPIACQPNCPSPQTAKLFFAPSNAATAGGTLRDFDQLFAVPNTQWPIAQRHTTGMELLGNVLRKKGEPWIANTLAPFIRATGMTVAFETGTPSGRQCKSSDIQAAALNHDIATLNQLIHANIPISAIFLESTISRLARQCCLYVPGSYADTADCPFAPTNITGADALERRVQDAIWYMQGITKALGVNTPKFGLINSSLAKGAKWINRNLGMPDIYAEFTYVFSRIAAAHDPSVSISIFQHDQGFESYADLAGANCSIASPPCNLSCNSTAEFQNWLISKYGVGSILELTSVKPVSNQDFHDKVIQIIACMAATRSKGREFIHIAFRPYPQMDLPDTAAYTETNNVKDIGAYMATNPFH